MDYKADFFTKPGIYIGNILCNVEFLERKNWIWIIFQICTKGKIMIGYTYIHLYKIQFYQFNYSQL